MWRCLSDSKFSGFDTIPGCDRRTDRQTDGRTDGRTHDDSIYRTGIASRGKNGFMSLTCFDAGLRQCLVGTVQWNLARTRLCRRPSRRRGRDVSSGSIRVEIPLSGPSGLCDLGLRQSPRTCLVGVGRARVVEYSYVERWRRALVRQNRAINWQVWHHSKRKVKWFRFKTKAKD